ncbi:hypothetical protein [Sphingobacterium corticibacter]|uniref:Lipoprotein n=1 Tax=Sphingobacterium corticibacter TaxID=2171749 RepID=A0A2T8HFZ4_9SPHI|nr:hypothetical protein [Sphingobacterium corticibacter]PVH24356.1 hypothetical protein DC487_14840 [Sphingobacterium corticibacter]
MKNKFLTNFKQAALGAAVCLITMASCDSDNNTERPSSFTLNREDLRGTITDGEVVLSSGTYKLTGKLEVSNGATLTIEPGVIIEATDVTTAQQEIRYIAVGQGAKINVKGTATNPVVMTATKKSAGAWGGLVICGKAPINKGQTATAEVSELTYGGTDANDNSGSVRYLRLEYTGYSFNEEKEFNGLSMFGVGKGTTIEYVQAYEGSDDGFEWFGGTVDSRYLVVVNKSTQGSSFVADDMFDWTEGWNGTGEFWFGWKTNDGNRGIEADNNSVNHKATPISNPTLRNLTLVGNRGGSTEDQAVKMRVGTNGNLDNVVIANWATGFDIQHDEGIAFINDGSLKATNVRFVNVGTKVKGSSTAGAAVDIAKMVTENANAVGAGNGVDQPDWAKGWTVGF